MAAFTETVTLHKLTGVTEDDTGNELPVYTDQALDGATVWPNGSSETTTPLDVATGSLTAAWESWPDITALDEMTVWGDRYAITGEPRRYRSPLTGRQATEVQLLRRV